MRPLCGPKTEGFFSATVHDGPLCLSEPGRRGKTKTSTLLDDTIKWSPGRELVYPAID